METTEQPKETILVAEDNASNYRLLEVILSRHYNLYHAWNGREAVEVFGKLNPKVVLMDVTMPVMDGYDASRSIRSINPYVPIIGLTAHAFFEDERKCYDSGMTEYMVKPINLPLLMRRLEELVSTSGKNLS